VVVAMVADPFLIAADLFDPQPDPYAQDPVGWARDILGIDLWSRQREILESVRDHQRTAARSGHGVGKTLTAAVAVLWFLDTHADSRVITTATTWSQVELLLWHEVGQLHRKAKDREQAQGRPIFRADPLKTSLTLPDGRYAIGLSSKPENSESFAGHHAPHILVIYDEASGVHKKIFEVGEGYMTTPGAKALLIGNPTRSSGVFFDAFHSERAEYSTHHISALESPPITGEPVSERAMQALTGEAWVNSRKRAWGEDSPIYQIRVLGQFAKTSDDAVFDLGDVEEAQERELDADSGQERVVIACDVARFGGDETVISERVGNRVRIVEHYIGKRPPASTMTGPQQDDLVATAGRIAHHAAKHPIAHVRLVVDDSGVGGGVTDILRRREWPVTAFNGAEQAFRPDRFPNRRSELWFEGAAQLEDLDLDGDDQLAADLTAPTFNYDLKLRRQVERKEETKKRLGRSPDRGDSVLLTIVPANTPGQIVPEEPQVNDGGTSVLSDDDLMTMPM
jgi:phage terminase large subunit